MELQTRIPLQPAQNRIDYGSEILLLGSCFTENIGQKLSFYKFRNVQNPFGVLFQPIAIERLVARARRKAYFTSEDLVAHNKLWHCLEAHSDLSGTDAPTVVTGLNAALDSLRNSIENATHIVLTLGTAWVYEYLESGKLVANCHKIPQSQFKKRLLTTAEILESLQRTFQHISEVNPRATIVLTVSPVRHIKNGFAENSLSKAHLLAALHEAVGQGDKLHYFPSYEIMMDELRDYRFYAADMLHPNQTAIDYIWEKFTTVWIDPNTESLRKEIATLQLGLRHRPLHPESEAHLAFLKNLHQKIADLEKRFPHISF